MNIRISNEQARVLFALLQNDAAVTKAVNTSGGAPIPDEQELQSALAEIESRTSDGPEDDGGPLTAEEQAMVTDMDRRTVQFARDAARKQHYARTGVPLRSGSAAAMSETEAKLATSLVRRKPGLSFERACRIVRGR